MLARWRDLLHPGGWIALTEVCGLFSHEPLGAGGRGLLDSYVREAFDAGRYDFDMGGKLAAYLKAAGFQVEVERILPDRELSFTGPAGPDVLEAWAERLARMTLLQERARSEFPSLKEEWLRCLSAADHSTDCRVHLCIARGLEGTTSAAGQKRKSGTGIALSRVNSLSSRDKLAVHEASLRVGPITIPFLIKEKYCLLSLLQA